jgi:hypothetical protein
MTRLFSVWCFMTVLGIERSLRWAGSIPAVASSACAATSSTLVTSQRRYRHPVGTSDDEIRAKFEAIVGAMGIDAVLDQMISGSPTRGRGGAAVPPRSRSPRRDEVAVLRTRVDLNRAKPAIWRRLDLRSDLTLDVVHQALQDAFGWTDSHLHRFTLSADPWDPDAEQYLCAYDVEQADDGFDDDAVTMPEEQVRLDEVLAVPGDVLAYVYDYGDNWDLTLRLERVLPLVDAAGPPATCVDGRRAAPPDDSGSIRTADDLAEVLDDPAHFDPDEVNTTLARPYYALRERGFPPRLLSLLDVIGYYEPENTLAADLVALPVAVTTPSDSELAATLRPHLWLLARAADGGIPHTAAGKLKPADVESLAELLPTMADWIGKANREDWTPPVARFRDDMTRTLGLLRKYKGHLRLTKAGAAVATDPSALFRHLAERLAPGSERTFPDEANLLMLAYAATNADGELPLARIAAHLTEIGYRSTGGAPVPDYALPHFEGSTHDILTAISDRPARRENRDRISAVAAALAHAALRRAGARGA